MFLPLAAVAVVALAIVAFASVGSDAGFEDNDGDLANDVNVVGIDWNSFSPLTWAGTAPYRTATQTTPSPWSFKGFEDAAVLNTDTGFAGGVKQDDNCGTTKPGKAPNKDDLKRVYLATATVNGDVFLEIAWVRIPQNSTSASAHVGYEFNQGSTKCGGNPDLTSRTGGDMLVVYDFEGGSDPPAIRLSRWLTSSYNPNNATCEVNSSTVAAGCWGDTKELTSTGFAEGKVNTTTVVDALKPGGTDPGPVEFGEAGINLTDAGVFGSSQCSGFGSAYAVSRSSGQSSQAAMEDIVGPGSFTISNCATVKVTKSANDNGSQAGAVFTLYSGSDTTGTVVGTCTVLANGTCSPDFTNLQPGTYTIDETTVPAGYTKDASLPLTFSLVAGETKSLSFTDQAAPGTVSVTKTDDAANGVPGATFTLYSPQGITNGVPTGSAVGSCTTGATGTCSITGVTPGTYTIDESFVPSGYAKDSAFPKNITITNGETEIVSATDPRKFKMIVLVCREADSTLYSSSVTINGDSRPNSLTAAGATTAGLSESALCGLTAGAKSGLLRANNPQSASVMIPASP
jgi:Prealbumin-like fold domain